MTKNKSYYCGSQNADIIVYMLGHAQILRTIKAKFLNK